MFNFGWGELVVIGIVALIAIGPKELPTVLRTLGQWMGKVRRMANEFQGQFQEALREAEFADLKKHADDISSSVSEIGQIDPLGDMQKDVERTFDEPPPVEPAAEATTEVGATPAALPDASPPPPNVEMPPPEPPVAVTSEDIAAAEPPPAEKAGSGA
jgi:sec-independent protein translocase protein TatB